MLFSSWIMREDFNVMQSSSKISRGMLNLRVL